MASVFIVTASIIVIISLIPILAASLAFVYGLFHITISLLMNVPIDEELKIFFTKPIDKRDKKFWRDVLATYFFAYMIVTGLIIFDYIF